MPESGGHYHALLPLPGMQVPHPFYKTQSPRSLWGDMVLPFRGARAGWAQTTYQLTRESWDDKNRAQLYAFHKKPASNMTTQVVGGEKKKETPRVGLCLLYLPQTRV